MQPLLDVPRPCTITRLAPGGRVQPKPWSPSAAAGRNRGTDQDISPCSWAYAAAAVRDGTSSFVKMLLRCRSTVF
jgi:hypothetical protein